MEVALDPQDPLHLKVSDQKPQLPRPVRDGGRGVAMGGVSDWYEGDWRLLVRVNV